MAKLGKFPIVCSCSLKSFSKKTIPHERPGIYAIQNTLNDKVYIGQSGNLFSRLKEHRSKLKNGKHKNRPLQSSYNKYGESNFKLVVIEFCAFHLLCERELLYINLFGKENIFNTVINGEQVTSGSKQKNETVKRIKENSAFSEKVEQFDKSWNYIQTFPSMSEAARQLGVLQSPIRAAANGRSYGAYGFLWKFVNIEKRKTADERLELKRKKRDIFITNITKHLRGLAENRQGKKECEYLGEEKALELSIRRSERMKQYDYSKNYKKVCQYDLNGNLLKIFDSIKEAKQSLGINYSTQIINVCRGNQKTGHRFIWKYFNDE